MLRRECLGETGFPATWCDAIRTAGGALSWTPDRLDASERKAVDRVPVFAGTPPELSRVVSRTGPQHAWLSEMLEVSKIARAVRSLEGSNPSPSADNWNPVHDAG